MKTSNQAQDGHKALQAGEDSFLSAIFRVVNDASNSALLSHLNSLLGDDALMAEAAERSHRHQLGFLKIVLFADGVGPSLRLHLWDQEQVLTEDIHSHCAPFCSRVVLGKLAENLYELSSGTSYARFRYRFDSVMKCSVAAADGFTNVSLKARNVRFPGETYARRVSDMHNVTDVVKGTITVSAWGTRDAEALVLKSDAASSATDCSVQIGMSEAELRSMIINIKERILSHDTP